MPLVYPILPGIDIAVTWRPKAFNFAPQQHASGREVRVAASQYPAHEFELKYNLLRDRFGETEFKTYMGFFLALNASLNAFCYRNPDDNAVKSQAFATTDGTTSEFGPIVRSFGANGYFGTEPVGYIDLTQTFRLYRDGVLCDPSDAVWGYSVNQATPWAQSVVFTAGAPPSGHVLTVDMSYFYWCRFSDDSLDFDRFMHQLWEAQNVKLVSLKG